MNIRAIRYYLGQMLRVEGIFLLPVLAIALLQKDGRASQGVIITIAVVFLISSLLLIKTRSGRSIYAREGLVIVALAWVVMSVFGALPFYISGEIPKFIDAWFETVSGFTTTGATILTDVEALSDSLLYWRSFTHWLGGMGVLVFIMAIVPKSGGGSSLHLLRAETTGPQIDKLVPKMRLSVGILYIIYIGMTVVEIALLLLGGMPFLEAVTTAFGTAGTGGFAMKNLSMAAYESYYLQTVVAVFMMLFGVNFTIYYMILIKQFRPAVKNEELRVYLLIILVATLIIAVDILPLYDGFWESLHHSYFQVASIITTTGFATTNFDLWPQLSRMVLLLLMVIGACAGSTGGGVKVARVIIFFKALKMGMQRLIHPRAVKVMHHEGKKLSADSIQGVYTFFMAYAVVFVVSLLLVVLDGFDLESTVTSIFACLNNVGPGFNMVGPLGNFSEFSVLSKLVLSIDMLIGRLEIFPVLMLFSPAMWRDR